MVARTKKKEKRRKNEVWRLHDFENPWIAPTILWWNRLFVTFAAIGWATFATGGLCPCVKCPYEEECCIVWKTGTVSLWQMCWEESIVGPDGSTMCMRALEAYA